MKKYRLKCYRCGNINEFVLGDWYHCQKCNEQQDTLCEMFVNDVLELEQQNKRYREAIEETLQAMGMVDRQKYGKTLERALEGDLG